MAQVWSIPCRELSLFQGASYAFHHHVSACWWGNPWSSQKCGLVINNLGTMEWLGGFLTGLMAKSVINLLSLLNEVIQEREQKLFRSIISSSSGVDLCQACSQHLRCHSGLPEWLCSKGQWLFTWEESRFTACLPCSAHREGRMWLAARVTAERFLTRMGKAWCNSDSRQAVGKERNGV